jgi:hypothetical protein
LFLWSKAPPFLRVIKTNIWDISSIMIKGDREEQVILPSLTPQPPKRKKRTQVRKALARSTLKFDLSWHELREITREP